MENNDLILLGRIVKLHGFRGSVVIALEDEVSANEFEMEQVFIEIDGIPVPFFIASSSRVSPETMIASFDYYESEKKMSEFVGCSVFADLQSKSPGGEISIGDLMEGFTLMTSEQIVIGTIVKVDELPMQTMLTALKPDGKKILVPLSEELITGFDREGKKIFMDLPEGLEEIN